MPLRRAIVGCHLLLLAALAESLLPPTAVRLTVTALLALPLFLTLRGLVQARRTTLQRLTVLLVAYIGGLSVEEKAGPPPPPTPCDAHRFLLSLKGGTETTCVVCFPTRKLLAASSCGADIENDDGTSKPTQTRPASRPVATGPLEF